MTGKSIFFAFILLFVLALNFSSACISFPVVEGKSCTIDFYTPENVTYVVQLLYGNKACELSRTDISILENYVTHGYSVKQQSDEEYSAFLKNVTDANAGRPDNCLDYVDVNRNGTWTGYLKTGYSFSNGQCLAMLKCGAGFYELLTPIIVNNQTAGNNVAVGNDKGYLIGGALALAVILIVVVLLIRKRK